MSLIQLNQNNEPDLTPRTKLRRLRRQRENIDNRFFEIRKHLYFRSPKTPRKHLSENEIYARKRAARIARKELASSPEGKEFFDWILSIQKKLGLTRTQFADLLGVVPITICLWITETGHFPSNKTYEKLLELEKLTRFKVKKII